MANGAGLQVDAIQTLRRYRGLLKGKSQSKYKNFDRDSYQIKPNGRTVRYKNATPEMLAVIKGNMAEVNSRSRRRSLLILASSFIAAIVLMLLLGKLYLYLFF